MPDTLAMQNLLMPYPQDWQGRQMPRSGLCTVGFDWCRRECSREERASGTQKETREQGAGKESESSLARSLATQKETLLPVHNFLVVVRHSLFGGWATVVYVRNSEENSSYLHTKQRLLCLHVSIFTHFNQPLTINNIAIVTRAWHKSIIPCRPSVRFYSVLFILGLLFKCRTSSHVRKFSVSADSIAITISCCPAMSVRDR